MQAPKCSAFDVAFQGKNWRERYLRFRSEHPLECPENTSTMDATAVEQLLYASLQPTGILYGFPVRAPWVLYGTEKRQLPHGEMLHFMFFDLLLVILAIDLAKEEGCHPNVLLQMPQKLFAMVERCMCDSHMLHVPSKIKRGFNMRILVSRHALFKRDTTRLLMQQASLGAFPGEFCNSFLLLDLYHMRHWCQQVYIQKKAPTRVQFFLVKEQQTLRRTLLMLMVAAAYANNTTSLYETRLIRHFIDASFLPKDYRTEAEHLLRTGISLDKVPPLHKVPWLIRQFFLHTTLMTLIDNTVFAPQEHDFTRHLGHYLRVSTKELKTSLTTIAAFFRTHHARFTVLNGKGSMNNLVSGLQQRARRLVKTNLKRIMQEIEETRELKTLLLEATKRSLTREEKEKVRAQLLDILKAIPSLAIFALPGGGVLLPILFQILPFNLLPSTFNEVAEEEN